MTFCQLHRREDRLQVVVKLRWLIGGRSTFSKIRTGQETNNFCQLRLREEEIRRYGQASVSGWWEGETN